MKNYNDPHEEEEDDYFEPDHDDYDQDYDSGMSESQQAYSDRSDIARENLESGKWDKTQADEFRAGA